MKITKNYLKKLIKEELSASQKMRINTAIQKGDALAGKAANLKGDVQVTIINSSKTDGYVNIALQDGDMLEIPLMFLNIE